MIPRFASALAVIVLAVCCAGCAPEPAPAPSATVFTSEEEAFAAAEETYRAYVDALNRRRSDPTSQPNPADFLIADALAVEIATKSEFDSAGLAIAGTTQIAGISLLDVSDDFALVQIAVCLDSTDTSVVDRDGLDVTPADRPALTSVEVSIARTPGALAISSSSTRSVGTCSE